MLNCIFNVSNIHINNSFEHMSLINSDSFSTVQYVLSVLVITDQPVLSAAI